MAYALLADVPAILGIYVSVFPVFVYAIFGPSHHISLGILDQSRLRLHHFNNILFHLLGTNALTCMLASTAVNKYYPELLMGDNPAEENEMDARIQVRKSSSTYTINIYCTLH